MQLEDNMDGFARLSEEIQRFYLDQPHRTIYIFDNKAPEKSSGDCYLRFLIDRKHVVEYRLCRDRGVVLGVISLAIGPQYFLPIHFLDVETAKRFTIEPTTSGVVKNLQALDECLQGRQY